jgi:probable rRNA maturation factor
VQIRCYDTQSALKISPSQVELLAKGLLAFKKIQTDEVIFHFVDQQTICDLHEDFFQDPSPTDCISFPIDRPEDVSGGYHLLGEVFVCPEVAITYAKEHALSPYDELSMYLMHGLLHLIGYDDMTDSEEKIMREEEKTCMNYLKAHKYWIDEYYDQPT